MRRGEAGTEQRLTRHSKWGWRAFVWLLVVALCLLAFELVKQNVSDPARRPWNVALLGVGPTVTFVVALLGWIVVRDQYGRTIQPVLRPVSGWATTGTRLRPAGGKATNERYRVVDIKNTGPGIAVIKGVRWRVKLHGERQPVDKTSIQDLRDYLTARELVDARDFVLANYSVGTSLEPGEERRYFECAEALVTRFEVFSAVFEFESALGDRFDRLVDLLPREGATAAPALSPPS